MAIGEKLDGVDIGLVPSESLDGLARTDVPQLSEGIASTGNEGVLVCRVQANAHDIAEVVGKLHDLGAGFNVPLHTGHVARRGENTPVIDETAARQVAGMPRELAGDASGPVSVLVEIIDGADVIQTTTGDIVAARGVGAGHDPRGAQRYGMDFVCGVSIPDYQLAVLRGRDEMSPVGRPVHRVDLGQVALQRPLCLHQLVSGDGLMGLLRHSAD